MSEPFVQFLRWYLVIQLITLLVLPLAGRLFAALPDGGYTLAKMLGVLLTSVTLWLGVSYGVMQNDAGGAWLSLLIVAIVSAVVGRSFLGRVVAAPRQTLPWRTVLIAEGIFLAGFALWAVVRSHDPAANHTEQPMDLMFMNSIWNSATFPPHDAWLSGYAISYYYLGYWTLAMLGRLAALPPAVAYNVGQACWFGLLLLGSFGIVYNLLMHDQQRSNHRPSLGAVLGGLLAAIAVGLSGNLQSVLEWLYAQGVDVSRIARWVDVYNFPENASVTNRWYIDDGWWWWRSSRVLEDLDLAGNHIEVIDEFPSFSYILGDNHPHVIAMPFVILVIGLALAIFWRRPPPQDATFTARLRSLLPLGWGGLLLLSVANGALLFFNTWDFPPYWLLLMLCSAAAMWRAQAEASEQRLAQTLLAGVTVGGAILAGAVLIYLPYFLTAQSQAGGIVPNLFHPTRLPQFLVMFGALLLGLLTLILLGWRTARPSFGRVGASGAIVFGMPLFFLGLSLWVTLNTDAGAARLARYVLPEGAASHLPFILERWSSQPFTFLFVGLFLTAVAALVWQQLAGHTAWNSSLLFALLLAAIALLLVYAPEFVYLQDNFGTRMNTIFKFYYQAWLLFSLSGAYAVATALTPASLRAAWWTGVPAALALLLILSGLIFPAAAAYSKTGGFDVPQPTFDATAYVATASPVEAAAIAWIAANTSPTAVVVESAGDSYSALTNRISTMTGRPTLLGWPGHELQWRGQAYGEMAAGRSEALERIYRSGTADEVAATLDEWRIDYVYVGPMERQRYEITPESESRFASVLDLVFEAGDVRIYRRRG